MSDLTESFELHPRDVHMSELWHATDLDKAASAVRLLQSRQSPRFHPDKSIELLEARAKMLDLPLRLIINARNEALDTFCKQWIKYRS